MAVLSTDEGLIAECMGAVSWLMPHLSAVKVVDGKCSEYMHWHQKLLGGIPGLSPVVFCSGSVPATPSCTSTSSKEERPMTPTAPEELFSGKGRSYSAAPYAGSNTSSTSRNSITCSTSTSTARPVSTPLGGCWNLGTFTLLRWYQVRLYHFPWWCNFDASFHARENSGCFGLMAFEVGQPILCLGSTFDLHLGFFNTSCWDPEAGMVPRCCAFLQCKQVWQRQCRSHWKKQLPQKAKRIQRKHLNLPSCRAPLLALGICLARSIGPWLLQAALGRLCSYLAAWNFSGFWRSRWTPKASFHFWKMLQTPHGQQLRASS